MTQCPWKYNYGEIWVFEISNGHGWNTKVVGHDEAYFLNQK